jgi:cephalosporin-C deacetylase-like acetyl esterase
MGVKIEEVTFWSGAAMRMAGRIFHSASDASRTPGVVFCHGFGGTKEGTPTGLSTILAEHGYTVLAFDYRGLGASEGGKGRIMPADQVEDAVHALEYLAQRPEVDGQRLAIYGTSFGGGVAALAALRSGRPRAAAMAVPVTAGDRWLRSIMRWHEYVSMKDRAMQAIAKKTVTGAFEMVDRFDIMVPDPVTFDRYRDKVEITLESVYHVVNHDAIAEAHRMRTPMLVMGVKGDLLSPVEQATDFYDRLPGPKELHLFETGTHFSVYDELLPEVSARTLAWFDRHVRA